MRRIVWTDKQWNYVWQMTILLIYLIFWIWGLKLHKVQQFSRQIALQQNSLSKHFVYLVFRKVNLAFWWWILYSIFHGTFGVWYLGWPPLCQFWHKCWVALRLKWRQNAWKCMGAEKKFKRQKGLYSSWVGLYGGAAKTLDGFRFLQKVHISWICTFLPNIYLVIFDYCHLYSLWCFVDIVCRMRENLSVLGGNLNIW